MGRRRGVEDERKNRPGAGRRNAAATETLEDSTGTQETEKVGCC